MHTATLVHLCQGIRQLFVISDQRASHTLIDLRVQAVDQTAPRHQRAVDQKCPSTRHLGKSGFKQLARQLTT